MDPTYAEIGCAIAVQIGTGIAIFATIRANLKNLTGWVKSIDAAQKNTHDMALETKTRVNDLPCRACDLAKG